MLALTKDAMRPSDLDPKGEHLTVSEVAAVLRVSTRTVLRYIKDDRLHALRQQGAWRIPQESVINYFRSIER
jgi:excisionase family DNA binding protein